MAQYCMLRADSIGLAEQCVKASAENQPQSSQRGFVHEIMICLSTTMLSFSLFLSLFLSLSTGLSEGHHQHASRRLAKQRAPCRVMLQ